MSVEDERKARDAFLSALDRPAPERDAWLRRSLADEPAALAGALELLAAHREDDADDRADPRFVRGQELGDFVLEEEIGRGGMGVVYLAEQKPPLRRQVALKVLPSRLYLSAKDVEAFRREAEALARVEHRSVLTVHAVGTTDDCDYIAMRYVDGHDLAREILAHRARRGDDAGGPSDAPIGPDFDDDAYLRFVAETVADVADGLAHAHGVGVVHRDVKPHNLLLTRAADVLIADFGLARDAGRPARTTSTTSLRGTLPYMSPEQLRHRTGVDHRTDIYSLGVVLYELLTLDRPYDGPTEEALARRIPEGGPPPITSRNPRVNRDLVTICETAMAPQPDDRYDSAADLRDDLRRFLAHRPIHARPTPRWLRAWRKVVQHRAAAIVGLLSIALVLGVNWYVERDALRTRDAELRSDLQALVERFEADRPDVTRADCTRVYARAEALERAGGLSTECRAVLEEVRGLDAGRSEELERRALAAVEARPPIPVAATLADLDVARDRSDLARAASDAAMFRGTMAPELAEAITLAGLADVEVTVPGAPAGTEITWTPVDVETGAFGAPQTVALPPNGLLRVPPGLYRLRASHADAGWGEVDVSCFHASDSPRVTVWLRRSEEVVADMVRVEGGAVVGPFDRGLVEGVMVDIEGTRDVGDFFIDRLPVTNGEYEAFVSATGREPPGHFAFARDDTWARRPVTAIRHADAAAYAAWAGKRLPTRAEWLLAARGPTPRRFPWGDDADADALAGFRLGATQLSHDARYRNRGHEGTAGWCAEHLRPVQLPAPGTGGPHGLGELVGLVSELTSEIPREFVGGRTHLRTLERETIGTDATLPLGIVTDEGFALPMSVPIHGAFAKVGFRCVRSE